MSVEFTARGSGYYRVFVDGAQVSRHVAEREAAERAVNEAESNPGAHVRYDHDYEVDVAFVVVAAAADTTAPTLSSATINSAGNQITFAFSEPVYFGAGGNSGFAVTMSGGAATLTYSSGEGGSSLIYSISRTIAGGETGTCAYTQPTNGVEDASGNDLVTFSGTSVTNNASNAIVSESFTSADVSSSYDPSAFGYNLDWGKIGYSNNRLLSRHRSTGGVSNGGYHEISLGGTSSADWETGGPQTNFDVHLGYTLSPTVDNHYIRCCWKVNSGFNTNPGENWKLAYHYYSAVGGGDNWVFWFRPRTASGFEPAVYSSADAYGDSYYKTEAVNTFYLEDFLNQWVCFEWQADYTAGTAGHFKLWITTEDGTYNETLYIDTDIDLGGTETHSIKIGAYWDGTSDANWFGLDEFVMDNTYIGPPSGVPTV